MRETLLKKRYGIPAALLIAILIGAGTVVAAFTYVYEVTPTVQRPVSEHATKSYNLESGDSFTETKKLDLVLPGTYDLKYKLTGDTNDHLKEESAEISLDTNDDGTFDLTKTISNIDGTVTFSSISGGTNGQLNQKIVISATAKDRAVVRVDWNDGNNTLSADTTTNLKVSMEPTAV